MWRFGQSFGNYLEEVISTCSGPRYGKNPFGLETEVQLIFAGKVFRSASVKDMMAVRNDVEVPRLTVTFSSEPARRTVGNSVRLINGIKLIFSSTSTAAMSSPAFGEEVDKVVVSPRADEEERGRNMIPWVVRVLSEAFEIVNVEVWSEAVIALESVFAAGLGGESGSAGAELVVDLVTKKLAQTLIKTREQQVGKRAGGGRL